MHRKGEWACCKDGSPFPKREKNYKELLGKMKTGDCQVLRDSYFFLLCVVLVGATQKATGPACPDIPTSIISTPITIQRSERGMFFFPLFSICKHAKITSMAGYNREQRLERSVGPRKPKCAPPSESSWTLLSHARDLTSVPIIPLL